MIYLILAVILSSGMSISVRYSEKHASSMRNVTTTNYVTAIIFCFLFLKEKTLMPMEAPGQFTFLLSTVNGCLYLTTLLLLQMNVRKNGTAVSASFSHLGVLVPTILSIFVFGEYPRSSQWIGVILAVAAILIINLEGKGSYRNVTFPMGLILLFLSGGCADMMSKVFEVFGDHNYEGHFLLYTFFIACLLSIVMIFMQRTPITIMDIKCGIFMGSFNYFSTLFLLKAILKLPAFLVYPVYSVGVIVVVNLINYLFLKEPLSKKEYIGMAMISIALIFLNI